MKNKRDVDDIGVIKEVDSYLSLIKRRKVKEPSLAFRSKVIARIKVNEDLQNIEPFLDSLKHKSEYNVPTTFSSSVMAHIKARENIENIDIFLESLKVNKERRVPDNFRKDVMARIEAYEANKDKVISPFSSIHTPIYKRFLAAASVAAAIALMVSYFAFASYTPEVADYMATDFLNIGIY